MLRRITHGPVTQLEWSWWRSRQLGYAVNSYLLRGELIDTGFPAARHEFSQLLEEVRPERVTLTHHHEDHAGNVDRVIARGIPIRAAPATATLLPMRTRLPLYRWWTWGPHRPAIGAVLEMSDRGTTLIPTPGHSDDHHVVWDAEEGILFSGDLFLAVKTRLINAWEDPRRSVPSLRLAAALEPRWMFDGHRGLIEDGKTKLLAKADWLEEMIDSIDRQIDEGLEDRAITRRVLGSDGWISRFSGGELAKQNLVRCLRRTHPSTRRP